MESTNRLVRAARNRERALEILRSEEVTPKQLSDKLGISYTSSYALLKRLERSGIVFGEYRMQSAADWSSRARTAGSHKMVFALTQGCRDGTIVPEK